ncbi:MAG: DUF177 domain-containing protein [Bacteroidota bacterium]
MRGSEKFKIDIYKLSNGEHHYDFVVEKVFFDELPIGDILEGEGFVNVILNKGESLIEANFKIEVKVKLECDRSLEIFPFDIVKNEHLIFKFGEENVELDDNIIMIHRDTQRLDLAHYLYEFIQMAVPMKKLHPKFGEDNGEDELIYKSQELNQKSKSDPRWEKLKSLKK